MKGEREREREREVWRGWPIVLPPRFESAWIERDNVKRGNAARPCSVRFRAARRLVEAASPLAVFKSGGAPHGKRGLVA